MHLGGERRVLEQLEELVLEDHRAGGRRDVAADLEGALVGLREVAALGVVPELARPCTDFRPACRSPSYRFGIEREVVARRCRIDPLQDGKADARLGLGIAFDALGQLQQGSRIQKVELGEEGRRRVVAPFGRGEAAVAEHRPIARGRQDAVPDRRRFLDVIALGGGERLGRHGRHRRSTSRPRRGRRRASPVASAPAPLRLPSSSWPCRHYRVPRRPALRANSMYLVAIAWLYVVVLMALAEALGEGGSWLGATITLVLYGACRWHRPLPHRHAVAAGSAPAPAGLSERRRSRSRRPSAR